jgi:hypothetical protein
MVLIHISKFTSLCKIFTYLNLQQKLSKMDKLPTLKMYILNSHVFK